MDGNWPPQPYHSHPKFGPAAQREKMSPIIDLLATNISAALAGSTNTNTHTHPQTIMSPVYILSGLALTKPLLRQRSKAAVLKALARHCPILELNVHSGLSCKLSILDHQHSPDYNTYSNTPHTSSEPREHITARGFVHRRGRFTLHADASGRCLGLFKGAGRFTGRLFDINENCERL
jgi:hypothetical protein